MKKETCGVVLATYNGEKYIKEQLESILQQTRIPDEVIIRDDGSKDGTINIVETFIEQNNLNWKLVRNEVNLGYANNFIKLLLESDSDLIFLCDQDDIWTSDKIEFMSKVMSNEKTINVLASDLQLLYSEENKSLWDKKTLNSMSNDNNIELINFTISNINCKRSGCTMCVRKSYFDKIYPYWCENWAHDDFLWKFSVLDNCLAIFHHITMLRRLHLSNATNIKIRTKNNRLRQIDILLESYSNLLQYSQKNELAKINYMGIKKCYLATLYRKKVVKNRNIFLWFLLLFCYRDTFPQIQTLILDGYFIFFNKLKR